MMTVLSQIPTKIQELIVSYEKEIEKAWLAREDELSITFSVKLASKDGVNHCDIGISFVKEKIKDKTSFTWDDKQMSLEFKNRKD